MALTYHWNEKGSTAWNCCDTVPLGWPGWFVQMRENPSTMPVGSSLPAESTGMIQSAPSDSLRPSVAPEPEDLELVVAVEGDLGTEELTARAVHASRRGEDDRACGATLGDRLH